MTGKTHMLFSFACSTAIAAYAGETFGMLGKYYSTTVIIGSAAIGALIPDADHPNSMISHKLGVVGKVVSSTAKHRRFYHSIWIASGLYLLSRINVEVQYLMLLFGLALGLFFFNRKSFELNVTMMVGLMCATILISTFTGGMSALDNFQSVMFGLLVGFMSHVIADMFNKDPVYFLFPLPVRFTFPIINITTGSTGEYLFILITLLIIVNNLLMMMGVSSYDIIQQWYN